MNLDMTNVKIITLSIVTHLCPGQHIYPVEIDVLHASAEVLLIAQEDLAKVAHSTDENAKVDVQLVETARDLDSEI